MQTQAESLRAETGSCNKKFDSHDLAQLHSKLGKSLAVSTQKGRDSSTVILVLCTNDTLIAGKHDKTLETRRTKRQIHILVLWTFRHAEHVLHLMIR